MNKQTFGFDEFMREICPHSREETLKGIASYIAANRDILKPPVIPGELTEASGK